MTAPFVNSLRTHGEPLRIGSPQGGDVLHLRAQVLEAWDALRVDVDPSTPVGMFKRLALRELYPDSKHEADFIIKFRGYEVLDENAPISSTGARNGSIFLITDRRRRPVE
ncbi:MAG TPA: hypothetical protein VM166_06540 [Gemmatimonadaceae bacterium]|nr:hypothetical protein [Gemmatimonadaceae bacterium]